jgi:hypothetical protein
MTGEEVKKTPANDAEDIVTPWDVEGLFNQSLQLIK